jgi:hypothetical protein
MIIASATRGQLPANEIRELSYNVLSTSKTMAELTKRLDQITDIYR